MRRLVIGVFTVIVIGILFVVLCTFVKRPYETVLLVRFGSLVDESRHVRIAYNWYFKLPTDSVVPIDRRLHLYTGPLQQVATSNREPISVRTFAAWRIIDPVKFYQTTGGSDQKAQAIIDQKMRGLVGGKLATYALDKFFNTDESKIETPRVELAIAQEATNGTATPDARERQTGLKEQGIEIAEVGFSRMAFPPANAEAVYNQMVSRLNSRAMEYQAEGDVKVTTLRTEGLSEAAKIRAEATAEAERIRGEGDARALQLIAEAQKTEGAAEFYRLWKSIDFSKNALARNTVLFLSTDNEWLRGLFPAQATPVPATRPSVTTGTPDSRAPLLGVPVPADAPAVAPSVNK
jgi:membrane protease subunit HflC